jgi:hypothetical protein
VSGKPLPWPEHLTGRTAQGVTLRGLAVAAILDGQPVIIIAADSAGIDAVKREVDLPIETGHIRSVSATFTRTP